MLCVIHKTTNSQGGLKNSIRNMGLGIALLKSPHLPQAIQLTLVYVFLDH